MASNARARLMTEEVATKRRKLADSIMGLAKRSHNGEVVQKDIYATNLFSSGAQVQVLTGDNRHLLPSIPSESVQCCVTSPPYWGLRDYIYLNQIGCDKWNH